MSDSLVEYLITQVKKPFSELELVIIPVCSAALASTSSFLDLISGAPTFVFPT